jgi:organic hydroperoxide reductase OsmC/OhrA
MLSYLAFCSLEGIEIVSYADRARGMMSETGGAGRFVSVVLEPKVVVAKREFVDRARALHGAAHEACFIANSMNFPVLHKPWVIVAIEETA